MFKRIKRTSLVLGIALTVILGMSYGTFIFTTNSYRSTEMLVGNLTYGIEITSTGGSVTINGTTVSLTSGKTSTVLLKITSLNKIISKYGIDYKMSSGTGSVKYASNTGWLPTGKINENNVGTYEKVIKVVISATTDVTVDFTVTGGYSNNDLIEVKDGYTRLTEIYDGIVDYKEDLKTIISKETTDNIYGGEAINNYLQYPTNTDTTKNIWRVLGYYNSVDGIKVVSNQTSTTVQSNISSSLTSFYNTLEKQEDYVLETNKFNCTNTTCTTSSYSNIGLLSTSEYNMLGGVNSYLASNESYFALDNFTIKNITSSGITETTTSTTSGLRPAIYLQNDVKVTGSGTASDPYRLSDKGDVIFASVTLNGTALETFPKESDPYIPKTVTCTNGSVGQWNTEKQKIELTTVNLPTSCVVDFTEGYTVTLNATNGTVTAPTSKVIGRTGTATFTVTPISGAVYESDTCNGTYSNNTYTLTNINSNKACTITFKVLPTLYAKLLADNPTISTRTDFSTPFTTNTANTLYKAKEDNTDVYYFAGVDGIVAHCEVEGITGDLLKFTDGYNSDLSGTETIDENTCKTKSLCNLTDYGMVLFDVTQAQCQELAENQMGWYDESMYSEDLTNRTWVTELNKPINNWVKFGKNASNQDLYWRIIRTNSDGSVRLLYHGTSTTATDAYIDESAFNSSSDNIAYVSYMYGSTGSIANARTNQTKSSTIKTTIDNWYTSNLEAKGYTKYLSRTAVYCNDRIYTVSGSFTNFGARTRLETNETPSYDCATTEDKFTVDTSTGNGKLTYPIALMTADEIAYAGGVSGKEAPIWYYKNSVNGSSTGSRYWWLLSPDYWYGSSARVFRVNGSSGPGILSSNYVDFTSGVRPAISLKSCTLYSTGNGSASAPYTIEETSSGC